MKLRRDQKIEQIARVPLFARCSKAELARVAALADEVELPEGALLAREGRPGLEFFVLLDGTVAVTRAGKRVASLGPGDFFGEIALVHGSPRTATVTATAPVRVLAVSYRDFSSLLGTSPQIQAKILKALAERLVPTSL
jgi:voltage-gated potassium channel